MNQLTTGQRIASRRKLLNLSQEALAEKLSVSRQAVSKWESDVAIPEIDKLIALGKIFEVSVGWLLGVEMSDGRAFTEDQLQTLDQMISKYQPPKKRLWWRITAAVCAIAVLATAFAYLGHHIALLDDRNEVLVGEISGLESDNNTLKQQLDDLNKLIMLQLEGQKLITDVRLQGYCDEKMENVSITCYLTPKIYQENAKPYLWVENPITGYDELIHCTWSEYHNWYVAKFDCPIADGYKWSFIQFGEYSHQIADTLTLKDLGLNYIGTYCKFHLEPENPEFDRLQRAEASFISKETTIFSYNEGIHTPHIFNKTAVAFKHITILLMLNDEVIWQKDYLNNFKNKFDVPSINNRDNPVYPAISVELPELKGGEELKLVLTAETVNGGAPTQCYETLLDYLVVSTVIK